MDLRLAATLLLGVSVSIALLLNTPSSPTQQTSTTAPPARQTSVTSPAVPPVPMQSNVAVNEPVTTPAPASPVATPTAPMPHVEAAAVPVTTPGTPSTTAANPPLLSPPEHRKTNDDAVIPPTRTVVTANQPKAALPTPSPATQPAEKQAANNTAQLNQEKKARFSHFSIKNRNVKRIFVDAGNVWFATSGGAIRYTPASEGHVVFDNTIPGILSNGVFYVGRAAGQLVIGTYGGGLSVMVDEAKGLWRNVNIPQGLADQFVYDVKTDGNGDVWIATWSGINRVRGGRFFDDSAWTTFSVENTDGGIPNPWIYGIAIAPDHSLWFATEKGLAHYDGSHWQNWSHADGLGADYAQVKDSIQFTNDPGKASRHHALQKNAQGLQNVKVSYNPNYIISLVVDEQGIVWCGTWGAGLARFDGKKWTNFTTADGLPSDHIFSLMLRDEGQLWVGTSQGLAKMNTNTGKMQVMTMAQGLYADNVFSMAVAPNGTEWIGSFGGVARIAPITAGTPPEQAHP